MGLFGKRKKKVDQEAQALNARLLGDDQSDADEGPPGSADPRAEFWEGAVRSLLLFIKASVLDIRDLEPDRFRKRLNGVLEKLAAGGWLVPAERLP